jgi:hypothetical protein
MAVAGGALLGVVDLLLQRSLPYPWANLANSSAVWAVGAFAVGVWARAGWRRGALAGVALLIVAVEMYYLAAVVLTNDSVETLWLPSTGVWLFFAVLAGAIFGAAGGLSRAERPWLRVVGVASPAAVLLAEAAMLGARSGNPGHGPRYRTDNLQTAALEAALGVVLLLVVARDTRLRLQALAAGVVLALIGFGAFMIAGFGS